VGDVGELKSKITLDATGFKQSMDQVKRKMQENVNEFKVASSAARAFGSAQDELKAKQKYLTDQIKSQSEKVRILEEAYRKSVAEKGADAKATQKLADQLATAKAGLNKMQGELNQTNQALNKNEGEVNGTKLAWERLKGSVGQAAIAFGNGAKTIATAGALIGKATMVGLIGAATAVGALGAGIGKLAVDTAATGEQIVEMSQKTSIGVERLQELAYIGDQVGTDLNTMSGALAKMVRSMKNTPDAFNALGVSVKNADGSLRDSEDVFYDVLEALRNMSNDTERDAAAMEIFGRSAMELNPLISTSADEFRRLSEEAHDVGAVLSEDDVNAAADFKDQLDMLKSGLKGTGMQIGSMFLPALSKVASVGGGYLKRFAGIVKESNGDFGKMGEGISQLAGEMVKELSKQAPALMKAGLGIMQGLIGALTQNLPVLIDSAMQIITTLVDFLIVAAPQLMQAAVPLLLTLINAIVANLPMLVQAALTMVVALANGISQALPQLMPAIVQAILLIVQTLLANLPLLIDAGLQLIIGLEQGLISAIPVLIAAIPQIVTAVIQAFKSHAWEFKDIGKQMVNGVWSGIQSMKEKFAADVKKFFTGIVDGVKKALNINSPSKVMIPIGASTVEGFLKGIQQSASAMTNQVNGSFRTLALAGGAAGYGALNEYYTFYDKVNIGGQTGSRIGQSMKTRRW